jgi:hypothetical protein
MTTYARILGGIVRETFEMPASWATTPDHLFAAATGTWVDVTAANPKPSYGWVYDATTFSPPPSPDDVDAREAWLAKLRASP